MSVRVNGVSSVCGVQECLVLLDFRVHDGRADHATSNLFAVRFAGPVIGRGSEGHGLGRLSRAVDGGAVSAEPDGLVLRDRSQGGGADPWWLMKAEGGQPGSLLGSFQMFKHTPWEGVKAEVPLGVRTCVKRTVEHSRARES